MYITQRLVYFAKRTSNFNLQKEVSIVGDLKEPVQLTPTYDLIYGEGNGFGPKEYIRNS